MAQPPKPRAPGHGERLDQGRRRFPGVPESVIDLSTGITPLACPVPGLNAHPGPDCGNLKTLRR
jgi:hypothetical protein